MYLASIFSKTVYVYYTIDETSFSKLTTTNIVSSEAIYSVTVNNGKIYTGDELGNIYVYNETVGTFIQNMSNLCSSSIYSVKFDCDGNLIYSCTLQGSFKILWKDTSSTASFSSSFQFLYEAFIDSKGRL